MFRLDRETGKKNLSFLTPRRRPASSSTISSKPGRVSNERVADQKTSPHSPSNLLGWWGRLIVNRISRHEHEDFKLRSPEELDASATRGIASAHEDACHPLGDYLLDIVSCALSRAHVGIEISVRSFSNGGGSHGAKERSGSLQEANLFQPLKAVSDKCGGPRIRAQKRAHVPCGNG